MEREKRTGAGAAFSKSLKVQERRKLEQRLRAELEQNARPRIPSIAEVVASHLRPSIEVSPSPPASDVEVIPGGVKIGAVTVRLSGKALKLVAAIINARHRRATEEIMREAGWPDDPQFVASQIYAPLSTARKAIKSALNIEHDPLPSVDTGDAKAWTIDLAGELQKPKPRARKIKAPRNRR